MTNQHIPQIVRALAKPCALALTLFVLGCGSGTRDIDSVSVEPVETPLKSMLNDVAERGSMGSGSMEIEEAIDAHPKSAALKEDFQALQKADGDKAAMQKVVDEMVKKL